jgi:hypothetical protein
MPAAKHSRVPASPDDADSAASCSTAWIPAKRHRSHEPPHGCMLTLIVRRWAADGACRAARLPLRAAAGVADLRGIFRRLICGAFPTDDDLPDYLASPTFYLLTPAADFFCLHGDATRTHFRLIASLLDGTEHTLAERELGQTPDPARSLMITVAEFDSEPAEVAGRQVVATLVSYPAVCVTREFLDRELDRLASGSCTEA